MAVLQFTLSEDGVSVLRDALACLGKFSDEVSLEAKRDRVRVELFAAIIYRLLRRTLPLTAGFDGPQHIQVGVCLRRLRHEPLLLQVPLRRSCAEPRQVLLQTVQSGTSRDRPRVIACSVGYLYS